MILSFHPSRPDRPYPGLQFLGYWHAIKVKPDGTWEPAYGFDRYEQTCGKTILPFPQDYVDPTWDAGERIRIIAYLKTGKAIEWWLGFSFCRFGCGEGVPGTTDLSDGTYVWPAGFVHYVELHGVRPPQEFIDHALKGG